MTKRTPLLWVILIGAMLGVGYFLYRVARPTTSRSVSVLEWIRNAGAHPDWSVRAGERCTAEAPFIMPTDGYIGYLWGDLFSSHKHQGLDIFGGEGLGVTPVVVAYPGYLTRLPDWKSAVIIRVPQDPLEPGRQIWVYYAHMADPAGDSFISTEFPPGTTEKYVTAGTLLGYQGNYSGDVYNPTGIHLHFSIVLDDGNGSYRNELEISNTLDPSPYFGIDLNAETAGNEPPTCRGSAE